MSAADITLRNGTVIPAVVLYLLQDMENRGLKVRLDGAQIIATPKYLLTEKDRAAVRQYRPHVIAVLSDNPERSGEYADTSSGTPDKSAQALSSTATPEYMDSPAVAAAVARIMGELAAAGLPVEKMTVEAVPEPELASTSWLKPLDWSGTLPASGDPPMRLSREAWQANGHAHHSAPVPVRPDVQAAWDALASGDPLPAPVKTRPRFGPVRARSRRRRR
jgi:hypothetical protein